jgi:glycosyltransferase involved in cell wall biosynthesis
MSEIKKADVSLIVPNFNNGRYLADFIKSVVNSTVQPVELIIVDDGSADDSLSVLDGFRGVDYLKVIRFEKNRGLTAALNAALDASKGRYVMRADPDDILLPEKIQKQYDFMEANPEVDVLGCNVIYFDSITGRDINNSNFPLSPAMIRKAFLKGEHGIQHPTAFARGEVYRKYRYQKIFPGEDYEIFARMISDGHSFANLAEPLYRMRVHPGSSTSNLKFSHIQTTFKFRDQIFHTKTSKTWMRLYFFHILFYRKFQITNHLLLRYLFLLISILIYPGKFLNRILYKRTY